MFKSKWVICLSGVVLVLLIVSSVLANGVYFPQEAYPAMPTIPIQRAIIVYRDGIETLIVESTVNSESPEVGWILPLPKEPEKLEVADSGMLVSMSMCLRPRLIHDLKVQRDWMLGIFIFSLPIAVVIMFSRNRSQLVDGDSVESEPVRNSKHERLNTCRRIK